MNPSFKQIMQNCVQKIFMWIIFLLFFLVKGLPSQMEMGKFEVSRSSDESERIVQRYRKKVAYRCEGKIIFFSFIKKRKISINAHFNGIIIMMHACVCILIWEDIKKETSKKKGCEVNRDWYYTFLKRHVPSLLITIINISF